MSEDTFASLVTERSATMAATKLQVVELLLTPDGIDVTFGHDGRLFRQVARSAHTASAITDSLSRCEAAVRFDIYARRRDAAPGLLEA